MKIIKLDEKAGKIVIKGIERPLNHTKDYFNALGIKVDQQTQLTFRLLGARAGHKKWIGYNRGRGISFRGSTTKTKKGSWNIRRGTDDSRTRRYKTSSKMFQAGGGFRQSWKILKTTDKKLVYGSRMNLAAKIMSDPVRPVLFVQPSDIRDIRRTFKAFYEKGIKF